MNPQISSRYRSRAIADNVIGLCIGYQRENLLARGLGLEHLREMLLRLARPLLRQGASLAYGGGWKETEDNFTYELLRLISTEQEDNSLGGPDTNLRIGRLYDHSAWPYYLEITPRLEAQWINCCRIVRVTQRDAGFNDDELSPKPDPPDAAAKPTDRLLFNRAVALSAMRRRMLEPMNLDIPEAPPEFIPAVVARVALGGKVQGFTGFLPGILEEALTILEKNRPLYLLGGFGGAAEVLAQAIVNPAANRPPELTVAWHEQNTADFKQLLQLSGQFRLPPPLPAIPAAFDQLWQFVEAARNTPAAVLNTGLTDGETRELLTTRDVGAVVCLVRAGLTNQRQLPSLAA